MKFFKTIIPMALFLGFLLIGSNNAVLACDSCVLGAYTKKNISTIAVSATTLKRNKMSAGLIFEYQKWNELDHIEAHELHEAGRDIHNFSHNEFYNFFLGYGLSDDLELNVKLPVVRRSFLGVEDGVVGQGDSSSGLGDLTLLGKYRFLRGSLNLSAIAGIKFPTGKTSLKGFGGQKLEPEEQAGSGSFDYLFGLAWEKQLGKVSVGGDFIYNLKTKGSFGYEFGDVFRADIAFSYPLREFGIFSNVRLMGGINSQFSQRDHSRTAKVFDSGGHIVFLTPGVAIDTTRNSTFFVSVPIPVIQNQGGQHPEIDFEVISGIIFNW